MLELTLLALLAFIVGSAMRQPLLGCGGLLGLLVLGFIALWRLFSVT